VIGQAGLAPFFVYALGGNSLNEEYCEVNVHSRTLKATIEVFPGVQKQCLLIQRITPFGRT